MCKSHGSQYGQNEWRLPPGESDIAIDSSDSAHRHARFRQRWKDDCSLPAQVRSIRQHGPFSKLHKQQPPMMFITKRLSFAGAHNRLQLRENPRLVRQSQGYSVSSLGCR